ncbi:YjbF family lipoprotein [Celeribacter arenosi]|uniref:YjbF family lipoprotein n=1 Tax=Celeribacter arenosi TaxID=792649 RepID=A0ABP7JYT8_9RHOB
MIRTLLATMAVATLLSGCGNDQTAQRTKDTVGELRGMIKARLSGKKPAPQTQPDPRLAIDATLKAIPGVPLQFVLFEKTGSYAISSVYGTNGGVVTWVTADKLSMSFDGPVLTATRGFGNDLMSLEDGGASAIIARRGSGTVQKTYRFLDGLDRTARLPSTCTIKPGARETIANGDIRVSATVVTESCSAGGQKFNNVYWVDASGRMVQSVQWGGPGLGKMVFQRLRY